MLFKAGVEVRDTGPAEDTASSFPALVLQAEECGSTWPVSEETFFAVLFDKPLRFVLAWNSFFKHD